MNTPGNSPSTAFTRDVTGRYVCNGLDEALNSADPAKQSDARPFDFIIIGGGSFGGVLASHLFQADKKRAHRILVLEAGPVVLPEHVQNLPPSLEPLGGDSVWDAKVWNSDSPQSWNQQFPGLAFCLGGRSLFWGGWSPYFIDSEVPDATWPANVKRDLMTPVLNIGGRMQSYLDHAAEQIGTAGTNDFLFGPLHVGLRRRLFDALTARSAGATPSLTGNRGSLATENDLEAPLAVQSASPRPGFFPLNKFNGIQLLIQAARNAQVEAQGAVLGDAATVALKKRLMVCANTRVVRLERDGRRITRVITHQFDEEIPIEVKDGARVILALGTIESTRQALLALPNVRGLTGTNLMAHLRSNLTVRIRRENFRAFLQKLKEQDPAAFSAGLQAALDANELGTSALFVKGIAALDGGRTGHFHLQITASGVNAIETNSEAELFKKLPSLDVLDRISLADDRWIVITVRGIGEMLGGPVAAGLNNRVALDWNGPRGFFDYGQPRALVSLEAGGATSPHLKLWEKMDVASAEVALAFADGGPIEYLQPNADPKKVFWGPNPPPGDLLRDKLGTTHHEGGTLWMGDSETSSVTNEFGKFWESDNLFAIGPCLLPTLGSPNPMLSGVALAYRQGDHLLSLPTPAASEPEAPVAGAPLDETGFRALFDGTAKSFGQWWAAGQNPFALIDGAIVAQDGGSLGLLFYEVEKFSDFTLRLQFKLRQPTGPNNDNSGVFIRFRDPRRPVPRRDGTGQGFYIDQTFVAVHTGFEIQIDEEARGDKSKFPPEDDGMDKKRTGAIYDIPSQTDAGTPKQDYTRGPAVQAAVWNTMEIRAAAQDYQVFLNGQRTTHYVNADAYRGKPFSADAFSGYIGLQAHTGRVSFRNIRIKP